MSKIQISVTGGTQSDKEALAKILQERLVAIGKKVRIILK